MNRLKKLYFQGKWQNYFTHKTISTIYIPTEIYTMIKFRRSLTKQSLIYEIKKSGLPA